MYFEVLGQPQGKQRARVTIRGGFAKAYTPEKTASYENLIMLSFVTALRGGQTPFWERPLEMNIKAVYAIPKSFSKKKAAEATGHVLRPTTKPDIDNVVKCVCDALNKVAYKDDTQIIRLSAEKFYGSEPKLIIEIKELNIGGLL